MRTLNLLAGDRRPFSFYFGNAFFILALLKSNVKAGQFFLLVLFYVIFFAQMDANAPSLHFAIFSFSCRTQRKSALFSLKARPGTIPLKLL